MWSFASLVQAPSFALCTELQSYRKGAERLLRFGLFSIKILSLWFPGFSLAPSTLSRFLVTACWYPSYRISMKQRVCNPEESPCDKQNILQMSSGKSWLHSNISCQIRSLMKTSQLLLSSIVRTSAEQSDLSAHHIQQTQHQSIFCGMQYVHLLIHKAYLCLGMWSVIHCKSATSSRSVIYRRWKMNWKSEQKFLRGERLSSHSVRFIKCL